MTVPGLESLTITQPQTKPPPDVLAAVQRIKACSGKGLLDGLPKRSWLVANIADHIDKHDRILKKRSSLRDYAHDESLLPKRTWDYLLVKGKPVPNDPSKSSDNKAEENVKTPRRKNGTAFPQAANPSSRASRNGDVTTGPHATNQNKKRALRLRMLENEEIKLPAGEACDDGIAEACDGYTQRCAMGHQGLSNCGKRVCDSCCDAQGTQLTAVQREIWRTGTVVQLCDACQKVNLECMDDAADGCVCPPDQIGTCCVDCLREVLNRKIEVLKRHEQMTIRPSAKTVDGKNFLRHCVCGKPVSRVDVVRKCIECEGFVKWPLNIRRFGAHMN